jgi:membrane-bound serine protease (ClpP class)
LAGLAGWEGVALVVAGLALIAAEVFIIPGFGIAGVLGAAALVGGLFISLIGKAVVSTADLVRAGTTVGLALGLIAVGALVLLRYLPRTSRLSGLVLRAHVGGARGETDPSSAGPIAADHATERESLVGVTGVAVTDLRPAGIGHLRGARVDVVTRGDYITAGELIQVIADEGYRRVVRRAEQAGDGGRAEGVGADAQAAGG